MNCEELWNEIAEKSPQMIETTLTGLKTRSLTPQSNVKMGLCMANKLTKRRMSY